MDLGTNSFHLLIADAQPDGHIDPIVQEKEMLRLGDVVSAYGSIPPTAADQAVATVRRFRLLADAAGADEIHARATSAIRRAENGGELVDRIEDETGVVVDVISGLEEARLIFGAVRAAVVLDPAPAVCFDLGGGSLEVMVGDSSGLMWATSVPLGVARLSNELVHSDPISKADRRALRARITDVLAPVARHAEQFEPKLAVGSSGTLENLAAMVAARRDEDAPASLNQLTIGREEFLGAAQGAARHQGGRATPVRRPRHPPRRPHHRGVDVPRHRDGALQLRHASRSASGRCARASCSTRSVVTIPPTGPTTRVRSAASRCSACAAAATGPRPHARQVATLALELFDQTREIHQLSADDRELLEFASLLHDIGEHVSSSGHTRHSAYLVRNGQLRGFDPQEIEMLAALVRWHRGGDPRVTDEFPLLDARAIERVRVLDGLLRVADGLDRGRNQVVYGVDVMATPSLVLLRLRATDDVELEVWGARRKRALLEKVLGREVELGLHPSLR